MRRIRSHSRSTGAFGRTPPRRRSSSVRTSWTPASIVWKVSALATIAIAIRDVCSPSSWRSVAAMRSLTAGRSAAASRNRTAASAMPVSSTSRLRATARSEIEALSITAARSSTPPAIQPAAGQRTGPAAPAAEKRQYSYRARAVRSSSAACGACRNAAGARSAKHCSMASPESTSSRPSRASASRSTVRAGAYSLSTTTGAPRGLRTIRSGRPPPLTARCCSAVRSRRQRGCFVRSTRASASLKDRSLLIAMPRWNPVNRPGEHPPSACARFRSSLLARWSSPPPARDSS